VFDVVLQLPRLEQVCHESGCQLAWGAAGAGCAAVGVGFVSVANGKRKRRWVGERSHHWGGQGLTSV
jgi:hypothetical protein